MPKNKKLAFASASAVSIFWGLSFIGAKATLDGGFREFSLVFIRMITATIPLGVYCLIQKNDVRLRLRDVPAMVFTSLTGITVYYYCELKGVQYTSASISSLIIATIPVFSLLTGVVLHRRRPPVQAWIGVALSLLGVVLLTFTDIGENAPKGFLFLFGACACWVGYLEVTDDLLKRYSAVVLTFWQNVIAFLTLIPLTIHEHIAWGQITAFAWIWAIVYLGLVCSMLCFLMNAFSVSVLKPQLNSVFLNLSPVATALGGYFLLDETIAPIQLLGGAMVLVSLFIVSLPSKGKQTT